MQVGLFTVVIIIWNLILSFLAYRILVNFRRLTKGVSEGNLEKILKSFFAQLKQDEKKFKEIEKRIAVLEKEKKFYFKKAGLVKFNPFSDLGGDQSFSLALLTDSDEGLLITSLHGRNTTRVYTKLLTRGDREARFSKEELRAINKAKGVKK